MTKKYPIIATALSLSLISFMALPHFAHAATSDILTNDTTGSSSQNSNISTNNQNVDLSLTNTANNQTTMAINASSGDSTFTGNTSIKNISTGNIAADLSTATTLNGGSQTIEVPPSSTVTLQGSNTNTGEGSTNNNSSNSTNNSTVQITNTGNSTQRFTVNATTGGLTVSNSTDVGNISTGNISIKISSQTSINGGGSQTITPPPITPGSTENPPVVIEGFGGGSPIDTTDTSLVSAATTPTSGFFPAGSNLLVYLIGLFLLGGMAVIIDPNSVQKIAKYFSNGRPVDGEAKPAHRTD